ncbi:Type 1 glutamine amidotransferase-like domain-containing protein [Galactobacter caseinivorans]|uniref:Peptidase E n=1 Tax=Galactobacter caseinivorans TaxID=2676123 RepID=A0A496PHT1_9MICC|nr:peptidase E [Galactobacter caseinivorans]RKW70010.1 peptidase E [Galactobacter caseinivorans]
MDGTLLTLGGGGFLMSADGSSLIDDLALELTATTRPRVCFIPTASGDAASATERFEAAFPASRAQTSVLSLFNMGPYGYTDPHMLLEQDLIYVGGGSTANLLALWRLHGLVPILEQAAAGTVLAGISAGMNCWFEASSTDSYGPLAPLNDGLGFLPGGACPHYLGEPTRRKKLMEWVGSGQLPDTLALDDGAAALWVDGELVRVVTERDGAVALRVRRVGDCAVEEPLETHALG